MWEIPVLLSSAVNLKVHLRGLGEQKKKKDQKRKKAGRMLEERRKKKSLGPARWLSRKRCLPPDDVRLTPKLNN